MNATSVDAELGEGAVDGSTGVVGGSGGDAGKLVRIQRHGTLFQISTVTIMYALDARIAISCPSGLFAVDGSTGGVGGSGGDACGAYSGPFG